MLMIATLFIWFGSYGNPGRCAYDLLKLSRQTQREIAHHVWSAVHHSHKITEQDSIIKYYQLLLSTHLLTSSALCYLKEGSKNSNGRQSATGSVNSRTTSRDRSRRIDAGAGLGVSGSARSGDARGSHARAVSNSVLGAVWARGGDGAAGHGLVGWLRGAASAVADGGDGADCGDGVGLASGLSGGGRSLDRVGRCWGRSGC